MLSGINTDIQYKGQVYHVQTEDGGPENPIITTLLFKGGAIFSSKKTHYEEILQSESYQEVVRELMKEQHKNMVRDLAAGKFERFSSDEKEEPKIAQSQKREPEGKKVEEGDKTVQAKNQTVTAERKAAHGGTKNTQPQEPGRPPVPPKSAQKKSLDDLILDYLSKKEESVD